MAPDPRNYFLFWQSIERLLQNFVRHLEKRKTPDSLSCQTKKLKLNPLLMGLSTDRLGSYNDTSHSSIVVKSSKISFKCIDEK